MNDWSDGKRFLFDHIADSCLYGAMFLCGAFLDSILNLLRALGLHMVPGEVTYHPYEIGKYQMALLILSGVQILRLIQKLNEWRYYK